MKHIPFQFMRARVAAGIGNAGCTCAVKAGVWQRRRQRLQKL